MQHTGSPQESPDFVRDHDDNKKRKPPPRLPNLRSLNLSLICPIAHPTQAIDPARFYLFFQTIFFLDTSPLHLLQKNP